MADIRPFRAWRYDPAVVGPLEAVVAPPYDVIDEPLRQALTERHPHNVIRLILGQEPAGGAPDPARYAAAAACWRTWRREGVLRRDPEPALYLCEQEFTVSARRLCRRAILARCRLEPFGQGQIYAHEETLAGPKRDRLHLLRATQANLSPIFGLYPDADNAVAGLLADGLPAEPAVSAVDHLGVVNRLWPITDPTRIQAVRAHLAGRPVFIADGHHRYETACTYREELARTGRLADADAPGHFVLMALVSMSDPGLVIQPTHRLLAQVPAIEMDWLAATLEALFRVTPVGSVEEAEAAMARAGRPWVLGLGTRAAGRWAVAELKDPAVMARLVPDRSPTWRLLGVSVLHRLVLDRLVLPRLQAGTAEVHYVHLASEAAAALRDGRCEAAFLVQPASVQDVRKVAGHLEKMPAKTTYFYPKLLSGLVFNALE